jgi:hypothetical protein
VSADVTLLAELAFYLPAYCIQGVLLHGSETHNEELHNFYSSPNSIREMKSSGGGIKALRISVG